MHIEHIQHVARVRALAPRNRARLLQFVVNAATSSASTVTVTNDCHCARTYDLLWRDTMRDLLDLLDLDPPPDDEVSFSAHAEHHARSSRKQRPNFEF